MKRISLISNSNIQYYKFKAEIDEDAGKKNKLYYCEPFDNGKENFIYVPAYRTKYNDDYIYFNKQELLDLDYLVNDRIKDNADLSVVNQIPEREIYSVSSLKRALKKFQNQWIPLPYFKNNRINKNLQYPTDWVRVYFDCDENLSEAKIIIAVDTALAKSENDKTGPELSLNPEENIYTLTNDENLFVSFLYGEDASTTWLDDFLRDTFYGRQTEAQYEKPLCEYIGFYLLLIKWFSSLKDMPEIQMYSDDTKKIPVDMVIDIGNFSTCALLFENAGDSSFDFSKVKMLKIQDYTNPFKEYQTSFPMNLVFKEAKFGSIPEDRYHNGKFAVPSFVRIGYEAEDQIKTKGSNLDLGRELKIYNSSPKRYLWDTSIPDQEWEFVPENGTIKKVYLSGISEQLTSDGRLTEGVFGSQAYFTKSSLMKFVFLEIILHAYTQINSFEFREEHGSLTTPRVLERITISCPTAMIKYEQIALRKAAEDACRLLRDYYHFRYESDIFNNWFSVPEIIPSIKDIQKDLSRLDEREDWNYDEATSCQLVFLYSLLSKKLKGNSYVISNFVYKNRRNLTIGSVDIGGGTTDLMIAKYERNQEYKTVELKPSPVYYDSFKLAGDDLMQTLIHQIVIQGEIKSPRDEGCSGVIENHGISLGVSDMKEKINGFFGEDSNQIGFKGKLMRKAFVHQVAIPIILYYLEKANDNNEVPEVKTFEEILGHSFENETLIKYFEAHFNFDFLKIEWTIQPKKVEEIVNSVFDGLIKQLCLLLNHHRCDYVIISGKPASLNAFETLFRRYIGINQANVINLNNYWIGKWYPFSDSRGYVKDAKPMVAVGSMISLMSNRLNKINDLRLNVESIKQKLISTADYIVKKDFDSRTVILTPRKDENYITVDYLPFHFGYSKIDNDNYPVSDLYSISLDLDELKSRYHGDEEQMNRIRNRIEGNFPLRVTISRDFDISKEKISIIDVEDTEDESYSPRLFKLNYQTLGNEKEYWLDNCEFSLSV